MNNLLTIITQKLKNLSKDQIAAIGIGVLVVLIGILYFIVTSDSEEPVIPPGSVDQPLAYEENKRIDFDSENEELFSEVKFEELPIYDLNKESHLPLVQDFLVDVGKGFVRRQNFDDILYQWNEDEDQYLYMTEYNVILDKVFFRFDDPVDPGKLTATSLSESQMEDYFKLFTATYWGQDLEYTNISVKPEGRAFRIEASRVINEVPVEVSAFDPYTDYLVVESNGRISEGLFHLFELDQGSEVTLNLVEPEVLGSIVSQDDYPKTFYRDNPVGFDITDFGYELYQSEPGDPFQGDTYFIDELEALDEVNRCSATKVSLVYLFVNINADKLTPVYRIDCRGSLTIENIEYDVPIVIYANAIDPEYVYVPGDL